MITAVKSAARQKHALLNDYVSLQRNFNDDESGGCLMDVVRDSRVADPEKVILERRMLQQARGAAREDLSSLEHRVLNGYLEGRTYQEMAGTLSRAPKAIDNALQRAKRKVSARLVERN
jgi:RNA polymerase sporulation-specific sigma factor